MQRLTCLDGLRGFLASYVMLSHSLPFAALPTWLIQPFSHGGAAVDVFFILSGLVIVQSLSGFGYRARPFLIARVARIYPVFLVVFAFAVAIQPLTMDLSRLPWIEPGGPAYFIWSDGWPSDWLVGIVAHLTMAHGLFPDGILPDVWTEFLGSAWSLSTEWQFYLLAVLINERLGRGDAGLRRLCWLFLAVSTAALLWHANAPEAWQFSRAFLPNKAQYFALGVASAVLVRQGTAGALRFYLAVLTATAALCAMQGGLGKAMPPLAWTSCLAAQLRPELGLLRPLAATLRSPPLVWLGAISYSLYLVHEPIQKLLGIWLAAATAAEPILFTMLWLPTTLLLPLLAAWWLQVWIEAPALRWGRILARRSVAVPAAAPVSAA